MNAEWFGGRLKELRARAGLTQQQLADAAGVSLGGLRDVEQGKTAPTWTTAIALCRVLGVTPDAFIQKPAGRPSKGRGRPRKESSVEPEASRRSRGRPRKT